MTQMAVRGCAVVYLGHFWNEADAAKVWDRVAVLIRGQAAKTNNEIEDYAAELAEFVRRAPAPLLQSCMPVSQHRTWFIVTCLDEGHGVLRSKLTCAAN